MKKMLIPAIFAVVILFQGCKKEDSPVSPVEEHFAAEGVYLSTSGIPVASIFRGVSTDTIKVPLAGSTDHMDVKFFDANRNVINPPTDTQKKLSWSIADTSMVELWRHADEPDAEYEIHLRGKKAGMTTIEFFILHEGHNDFRSGNIKVLVQ
ncbi:MAG: hypothetical protein IPI12_02390 [Ignavibacteriales bacterium]|jgi:hypothetical protein|nr:hypothetical protein [Ignavibacteriales bacterium]MBP9122180.1 hypothetical protein [Ignavibacteriaceae bacterium]MCC6638710.1 hypothetical protein [Ignavibacteriaceae bacterium]